VRTSQAYDLRSAKKRPFPVHHLLFALAPILFLYSHNAAKLPIAPRELLLPLAISFAAALVLWLLLWLVLRSSRRAALVVSLFLALFFLYGRAQSAVGPKITPTLLPAIAIAVLLLGTVFFARRRREFSGLTVFLNLVSLTLVLINLVTGVPSLLRSGQSNAYAARAARTDAASLPDIYYVILDAHARSDVLKDIYNYDNSNFIRWLTENGFHVAAAGRSNYSQTYLSLASSLNLTYLDSVAARVGPESENRSALVRMIGDSRVVKELRQHGYTIASFASGYTGTDLKDADVHFAPRWALSEFQNVLISTTPLPLILERLFHRSQYDVHRAEVLHALQHLPDAARLPHPVFVFAHIVSPHPPFVFGPGGEKVNPKGFFTMTEGGEFGTIDKEEVRRDYIAGYRDQVVFLDGKLEETVGRILRASPQPPVIILQADHGPGSMLNWDDPEPDQLAERFAIFNAYHIPGGDSLVYDSITPVNTFRLLFNRLFAAGYQYLPDKSWFSTIAKPWHFYDADSPVGYVKNDAGLKLSIVAFRGELRSENPGAYCRRLVAILYPGKTVTIERFYVQGSDKPLVDVGGAYQLYRDAVVRNELPDLGTQYDSFQGKGPDGRTVTALFFAHRTP
jgi:hypothetical protein